MVEKTNSIDLSFEDLLSIAWLSLISHCGTMTMKNFGRALRDAMYYWKSLAVATACSVIVAFFWSFNIAAFYPILQVVLENKTIQAWADEQIANQQTAILQLETEIAQHNAGAALVAKQNQLNELRDKLEGYQDYRPWLNWLPKDPFQTVAWIVGFLMFTTLAKHAFLMINELLVARIAMDICRGLRSRLFHRALYSDRETYSRIGTSGYAAYIMQTADGLAVGLTSTLGGAVREPLKIVGCLIGAALIAPRLLLLSIVVAPAVGWALYRITQRLKAVSRKTLGESMSFYEVMLESLNNLQTVQAYTMEDVERKRFDDSTTAVRAIGLKFVFYTALSKPVIECLGLGMLCTTIVCGSYLVLKQQTTLLGIPIATEPLSVGGLLTFFGFLIAMTDPLRKISAVYSCIYAGAVAADAIYGILDHQGKIQDPDEPTVLVGPHKLLTIENVSFGYRDDHRVIRNVDLRIPLGATVAIIGANGSGKSTLINLLCRFYDPQEGRVALDDIDLRDMRIRDVRSRVALVTQQTELFNESVRYNIRYGTPDASDAAVEQAAHDAHAYEFIVNALPQAFETKVGQAGHRLSGGQRQRISLARALLRNPEILILDECTSQIDMRSEELIRDSLAAHRGKRTMIIITHREALLDLADVIYEVRNGEFSLIQQQPVLQAA